MQINEAIRIVRGMVKQKHAFAATTRAHPFFDDERYMQHIANEAEREAEAMRAVCDALEVERNRNGTTSVADFLSDSGGDGQNDTP